MWQFGDIADGKKYGTYEGIVRIVFGDRCKVVVMTAKGYEDDKFLPLDDCKEIIDYKEGCGKPLFVWIDNEMRGEIFKYEKGVWRCYGETMGYA